MTTGRHLLDGRFTAWLAAPDPPTPLWLFVHVPKTAGSSLAADLGALLPPYRSIHIDHTDRSRPAPDRYDDATDAFLARQAMDPCRFASGHVQFRHVRRILDGVPGTRLFTMLREPIARLVSDYLYQRSPMHPLAAEMRARIPDFAAFIELKGQRNRAARHLLPPNVAEAEPEVALGMLRDRYAFIGIQERYALSFRALALLVVGSPARPGAPKRVNDGATAEKAAVMAALDNTALRTRIADLNALDIALYQAVAADWAKIAAPLVALLTSRESQGR